MVNHALTNSNQALVKFENTISTSAHNPPGLEEAFVGKCIVAEKTVHVGVTPDETLVRMNTSAEPFFTKSIR